jgi:pyruvate,water dikinase
MTNTEKPIENILRSLRERAKELDCLYRVDELLSRLEKPQEAIMRELIEALPLGWQYPEICRATITLGGRRYQPTGFAASEWYQRADVLVEGEKAGEVTVYYAEQRPTADEGPFLKEERRLIAAIAERIGLYMLQKRLRASHNDWETAIKSVSSRKQSEWEVILDFLRRTDPSLLARITRKMINYLCWTGTDEAELLLQEFVVENRDVSPEPTDDNRPSRRTAIDDVSTLADKTFAIANRHVGEEELIGNIRSWIEEEKASYLVDTAAAPYSSLADITAAVERFELSGIEENELPEALRKSLRVSLLRRFFSGDPTFLTILKDQVRVSDFWHLLKNVVFPSPGHGKLGGKSTGLFMAERLMRGSKEYADVFNEIKVPKTWYISSDGVIEFLRYNDLEDIYDRKYMDVETIRRDYPRIVQVLKNSRFPPELSKGLAVALDDFEERPLIVRSSSLLEDQIGAAFSGKYKSLFVANQGSKKARLEALQDAIAEVYASIFGPDPIEYRSERGLLDAHEEMAIMIQEVVGNRVGGYFFPAFAGVAFSHNEFRWSPRIKRDDGLVRLVPGLGTRAVDRLSDDYPVLFAPGQPGLRVNVTPDEIVRYSPQKIDVINLEKNSFETVSVQTLLREVGDDYPLARKIVSIVARDQIRKPAGLEPTWDEDDVVVTFQGLIEDRSFADRIRLMMSFLRDRTGFPVDIEFAADAENLYILQCRAQSASPEFAPAPIPRDLPRDRVIFTANRYISNGRVPDVTHVVYVDPERYGTLPDRKDLEDVGHAVGKLNKLLPKRQFILIGPGRWGSRGDIRLGVGVTYSDINNTSALLEVARKKGNYVPELSFGTHFFQDLVEADIRYVPLYPDEDGIIFNELFLRRSKSIFKDLLPEFSHLEDTIRVIDVPNVADGYVIKILMNADLDEAVGILSPQATGEEPAQIHEWEVEERPGDHWRWRLRMAERIAAGIDPDRFGVKAAYVFGSTKNATAGPASDLDLIVHIEGDEARREALSLWLAGWSRALAEVNFLRTGYTSDGLLDVHYVTDDDIARRTSYAAKINAITDAARPLAIGIDKM